MKVKKIVFLIKTDLGRHAVYKLELMICGLGDALVI